MTSAVKRHLYPHVTFSRHDNTRVTLYLTWHLFEMFKQIFKKKAKTKNMILLTKIWTHNTTHVVILLLIKLMFMKINFKNMNHC